MLAHHVVLHLGHKVHSDHHNNEQRCAAEIERYVVFQNQKLWQQAHKGDVDRAHQSQAHQNLVDVFGCLIAWANTRNKSAALFQVVGGFLGIEHQCGIEKAKENLLSILRAADLVKFAKMIPMPDANIRAMESAYKFIDFTEPNENKEEKK